MKKKKIKGLDLEKIPKKRENKNKKNLLLNQILINNKLKINNKFRLNPLNNKRMKMMNTLM